MRALIQIDRRCRIYGVAAPKQTRAQWSSGTDYLSCVLFEPGGWALATDTWNAAIVECSVEGLTEPVLVPAAHVAAAYSRKAHNAHGHKGNVALEIADGKAIWREKGGAAHVADLLDHADRFPAAAIRQLIPDLTSGPDETRPPAVVRLMSFDRTNKVADALGSEGVFVIAPLGQGILGPLILLPTGGLKGIGLSMCVPPTRPDFEATAYQRVADFRAGAERIDNAAQEK